MAYNITLSSSMRSNLLSLRNISTQMSRTQNILSTGKKVNSAIDNATSYYQARSLTHRAADLNNLLDSMSQGIQTINVALEGLERYDKFLEQATIIATESYEKAVIPTKDWIMSQIGGNGAVVSTAQELKDAVASGKKTICVYGKIDYFEDESITLKEGQKLVGTEYFTGYSGTARFSGINFKGIQDSAITTSNNNIISDLDLNFDSYADKISRLIQANFKNVNLTNLDITHQVNGKLAGSTQGTLSIGKGGDVFINGIVNIASDRSKSGVGINGSSSLIINKGAELNINITNDAWGGAILSNSSKIDVYGKLNCISDKRMLLNGNVYAGNQLNIYEGAEVIFAKSSISLYSSSDDRASSMFIEKGAKIYINDNSSTKYLYTETDYLNENKSNVSENISSSALYDSGCFSKLTDVEIDWDNYNPIKERKEAEEPKILAQDMSEYEKILNQLDDMVEDSSYQGINLLKGDELNVVFNEDRSHNFVIKGVDIRSMSAGISTRTWETKEDLANSLKELKEAISKVRAASSELGNKLSIIQTRQTFTDALVDVLEVGADKLVLADMNEVSAEYLTLQTRQQLAVNSLSLASQSASSVLGLF